MECMLEVITKAENMRLGSGGYRSTFKYGAKNESK